jgi:hypothetical protein
MSLLFLSNYEISECTGGFPVHTHLEIHKHQMQIKYCQIFSFSQYLASSASEKILICSELK